MVWPYHKVFWFSKDDSAGHSARKRRRGRKDNIKEWTGMDFASSARQLKTGLGGKGLL